MLLLICSAPALMIWSSKSTKQNFVEHYVRFKDSVAGLNVGNGVLFGGIPIGHVTAVGIDPHNSSLARVDISVDGAAPIFSDSKATLRSGGISGNAVIDISRGGRMRERRLKPGDEIVSRRSPFQQLVMGLQAMPAKADLLIERVSAFYNAENASRANRILANIDKLSAEFSAAASMFYSFRADSGDAVAKLRQAQAELERVTGNIDRLKTVAKAASEEIQNLTAASSRSATDLSQFVEENRQPIQDFALTGFLQLLPMIREIHQLGGNLDRLWTEVRQGPVRFFFTDRQQQGFEPPPSINQHH